MEPLDDYKNKLRLRKYSYNTIKTYCDCMAVFVFKVGTDPSVEAIEKFLLTLPSNAYHRIMVTAIHHYYKLVLNKPLSLDQIPYPRREYKTPEVFSVHEMKRLFKEVENLKHKAILSLLYGCGMRVSEVLNLKVADIDSSRMVITIRQAKGNKDRQVMLDKSLLLLLREYYKKYNPAPYMFDGQKRSQYSERSINNFLKYYADKAGINKNIHAHKIRHTFATHLLEAGTDMAIIQDLLGHNNIRTTKIYAKITSAVIKKVKSPVASMNI